ncbi:MAG: hypothetical protein IT458_02485 [Planctomycetes bacterium]|nr:hypothetical protein [Planctomycetota bacterium]
MTTDVDAEPVLSAEFVSRLRTLRTEPTGRVELVLRAELRRRGLAKERARGLRRWLLECAVVAAAAAATVALFAGVFAPRPLLRIEAAVASALPGASLLPGERAAAASTPAAGFLLPAELSEELVRRVADVRATHGVPDEATARTRLYLLREEFEYRASAQQRQRLLRGTGSGVGLHDRIQALAVDLAEQARSHLATVHARALVASGRAAACAALAGEPEALAVACADAGDEPALDVQDLAFAVRGLLAAGVSTRQAPHAEVLRDLREALYSVAEGVTGGELGSVLAALADLSVAGEPGAERRLVLHGARFVRDVLGPDAERAGGILSMLTPAAELADAGRVLRILPALGIDPELAALARYAVLAHLESRSAAVEHRRPADLAALLYGFGDLVSREEHDQRLLLHAPRTLLPEYVAMHQLAWSRYPLRRGWGQFQAELRGLATLPTPPSLRDAGALLLTLTTTYAAPGMLEVAQILAQK